jgi:hypothetical protein
LWLDGGWVRLLEAVTDEVRGWGAAIPAWNQEVDIPRIAKMSREVQPGLLVVDRTVAGPYENYQTPEQAIPAQAKGCERAGINDWRTKNFFYLERGSYTIVSAMTENKDTASVVINRQVIDLFNPVLPVLNKKEVHPGEQAFLYDLQRIKDHKKPSVLCAVARIYKEGRLGMSYSFTAKGPTNTKNAMRIFLPIKPLQIEVGFSIENKTAEFESEWDENSHTLLLQFQNRSEGIDVKLNW